MLSSKCGDCAAPISLLERLRLGYRLSSRVKKWNYKSRRRLNLLGLGRVSLSIIYHDACRPAKALSVTERETMRSTRILVSRGRSRSCSLLSIYVSMSVCTLSNPPRVVNQKSSIQTQYMPDQISRVICCRGVLLTGKHQTTPLQIVPLSKRGTVTKRVRRALDVEPLPACGRLISLLHRSAEQTITSSNTHRISLFHLFASIE